MGWFDGDSLSLFSLPPESAFVSAHLATLGAFVAFFTQLYFFITIRLYFVGFQIVAAFRKRAIFAPILSSDALITGLTVL